MRINIIILKSYVEASINSNYISGELKTYIKDVVAKDLKSPRLFYEFLLQYSPGTLVSTSHLSSFNPLRAFVRRYQPHCIDLKIELQITLQSLLIILSNINKWINYL